MPRLCFALKEPKTVQLRLYPQLSHRLGSAWQSQLHGSSVVKCSQHLHQGGCMNNKHNEPKLFLHMEQDSE